MRGDDNQQEGMFSYVSPEKRVPADHPLRPVRKMVDEILKEMSPQFAKLYSEVGRPSIAPERLFRSLLLQIFYSVRSERMPGTCTDGEPQRSAGTDLCDRGPWKSGAGSGDADGRSDPGGKASDVGRRQELRHAGIGRRTSRDEHHAARGAK